MPVDAPSPAVLDSFELLYQPEVELATGAVVAMEGLLRRKHPTLGPGDLGGAAPSAGERLLRAGADEAVRWASLPGRRRRLWLAVRTADFVADGFAELVADVVGEHGLAPGALGLKISESSVIALGPGAAPLLADLREAGVALAVDGFSSFYATLGAIQGLSLDAVTLARRYVRGVGELVGPDGQGDPLVTAVIEQAHAQGLHVVAERVDTWGEAARLTELGCDRAHGWLFGGAQPAQKAHALLLRGYGWQPVVPLPRGESGLRTLGR